MTFCCPWWTSWASTPLPVQAAKLDLGMSQEDVRLLDEWRAGDTRAGEVLFDRHFDSIYRFFSSKARDDAQELVQRTMTACLEKRDHVRKATSFRAFLFGVARFELLRHLRSVYRRSRRECALLEASIEDLLPSPSVAAAQKREHRLLLEALRRIPIDLQIVVELHFWEELTTQEIAEVVGIPPGTVKSRLRRARERLSEQLELLATDPVVLRSTVEGLERWAADVKDLLGKE